MKKLLLGSAALTLMAIAISLFQISCNKVANAQTNSTYTLTPATTSKLGGVIIDGTSIKVDATGKISTASNGNQQLNIILYAIGYGGGPNYVNSSASEYWTMNYDGTNPKKVPLTFASGFYYSMNPRLSPDGKTIFFSASDNNYKSYLYSCSIDGTNLKTLLTQNKNGSGSGANIEVSGAY
jgi:hypothetical protein